MKKILFVFAALIVFSSCNFSGSKEASSDKCCSSELKSAHAEALSVEDLLASPDEFIGKTISLKGLCVHTCKHSGKKMFLQGIDEDQLILVLADGELSGFEKEITGSQIIVTGLLTAKEVEAENHEEGETHSCETDSKSKSYQIACTSYKIITE